MQHIRSKNTISNNYLFDLSLAASWKLLIIIFFLQFLFLTNNAFSFGGYPACDGNASAIPRSNCKDLVDLPLCSLFSPANQHFVTMDNAGVVDENINCVKECSDPIYNNPDPTADPPKVRGKDYAINNTHCIRFCDTLGTDGKENDEKVEAAAGGKKCVARKCHQLSSTETPNAGPNGQINCAMSQCSVLTLEELRDNDSGKFAQEDKKYCQGDEKCYKFSANKLPYIKYRGNSGSPGIDAFNSMCKIQDCPPPNDNPSCNRGIKDGWTEIKSTPEYEALYKEKIDPNFGTENSICHVLNCKQVFYRDYRCSPHDDTSPTQPDVNCDSDSVCTNGYCTKKIDCNKAEFAKETECNPPDAPPPGGSATPLYYDGYDVRTESWFYRPSPPSVADNIDKANLCYTMQAMKDNDWGTNWANVYTHASLAPRGPGFCGLSRPGTGTRGVGWVYLCGTNASMLSEPNDSVGYFQGYAKADYAASPVKYQVTVCLRYKNAGNPRVCGTRECSISCAASTCKYQSCGRDLCKVMTITKGSETNCIKPMGGSGGDCQQKMGGGVDDAVRIRTVKYDNRRICAFLDVWGTTAYPGQNDYFTGKEKLKDGTCVDGTVGTDGNCNGHNSNNDKWKAFIWRAVRKLDYISNDLTDFHGRKYKSQECAKIPLRISTPRWYGIANEINTSALFSPILYISKVNEIKGGEESKNYMTDFHNPEIEVTFGKGDDKKTALLSLGKDKDGLIETDDAGKKELSLTINTKQYLASVMLVKEYNAQRDIPIVCLYRKQPDGNGNTINAKIECVSRDKPEIDDTIFKKKREALVYGNSSNSYDNFTLNFRLKTEAGTCSATSDSKCTAPISFPNPDLVVPTCKYVEEYKICATREPCSELFKECIKNEIALIDLMESDPQYESAISKKEYCDQSLLPSCNKMWGFPANKINTISDLVNDMPNTLDTASTNNYLTPKSATANAYGWFNEACITQGFDDKLVNVVAHKVLNGNIKGKCLIDSFASGADSDNRCASGGNAAKNCRCFKVSEGSTLESLGKDTDLFEIRRQTLREAGLCVDIPLPKTCPAIDYGTNSVVTDLYFIQHSINKDVYGDVDGVHTSHEKRTLENSYKHANFGATFGGVRNFKGNCFGYWKDKANAYDIIERPTMSCNLDGTWNKSSLNNPCIRYQCIAVNTYGLDITGKGLTQITSYAGNYAVGEAGDNRGLFHGFANWDLLTKADNNDYTETQTASSCIPGYKPKGSGDFDYTTNSFPGGTLPKRKCNQIGQWLKAENECERVKCKPVNPPTDPQTQAEFDEWVISGGATFPEGKASRNTSLSVFENDAIIEGKCYEGPKIKFFKQSGDNSKNPTRTCDYRGKWGPVQNECVTSCDAINTAIEANSENNGFAYWEKVEVKLTGTNASKAGTLDTTKGNILTNVDENNQPLSEVDIAFIPGKITRDGCFAGLKDERESLIPNTRYVRSPYSPKNQVNIYNPGTDLSSNPKKIVSTPPAKKCVSILINNTSAGQRKLWETATIGCVNKCPGYLTDPRIGVGKTREYMTSGSEEILDWPDTNLGEDAIISNPLTITGKSVARATNFTAAGQGTYFVKRHCGTNGRWQDPVRQCAIQYDDIMFSANPYSIATNPNGSETETLTVNTSAALDIGTKMRATGCRANFWRGNRDTLPFPQMTCTAASDKLDGLYWNLTAGNSCEEVTCLMETTFRSCVENEITSGECSKTDLSEPAYLGWSNCKCYAKDLSNSNSTYNGTVRKLKPTEGLNLSCKDGYGKALSDPSFMRTVSSSDTGVCGLDQHTTVIAIKTDRSTTNPRATCGANGKITITDDCTACRDCTKEKSVTGKDIGVALQGCANDGDNEDNTCEGFSENDNYASYTCRVHYNVEDGSDTDDYVKYGKVSIGDSTHNKEVTWFNSDLNDPHHGYITTKCVDQHYIRTGQRCQQ